MHSQGGPFPAITCALFAPPTESPSQEVCRYPGRRTPLSPTDRQPGAKPLFSMRRLLFSKSRARSSFMSPDAAVLPDATTLGRWLDENDAPGAGEQPELEILTGGSQNTLYRVRRGDERTVLGRPGSGADAT